MKKILVFLFIAALAALTACEQNDPSSQTGALKGKFSVNASGTQVQFAKGNLQYQATTDTWRFAEHQYDTIGEGNTYMSASYDGWIDLFGWGTGNAPTRSESETFNSFVDWGVNPISNGGNQPNQWRTLTADEWIYLIFRRDEGAQHRLVGLGTVNGINGFFLLPDDWNYREVPFVPIADMTTVGWDHANNMFYEPHGLLFDNNHFSAAQWAKMEQHGAVFFPCAGMRSNGIPRITNVGLNAYYWSSTPQSDNNKKAYGVECWNLYWTVQTMPRLIGRAVRLVQEVQ